MAYIDAGTGSLLVLIVFLASLSAIAGWVLNIVAAVFAWQLGRSTRSRFILHIIGFFFYPLGSVLGFIWLFKWRGDAKMENG